MFSSVFYFLLVISSKIYIVTDILKESKGVLKVLAACTLRLL